MINIVVPMAGRGSRFQKEGYELPKPLIPVLGKKPMIEVVIHNLKPKTEHRFIFLCLKEHIDKYQIDKKLKNWCPNGIVISVDGVTEGAACTVLLAKEYINNDDPLMIANSDQYVDIDINDYLNQIEKQHADGLIMTLKSNDPKWSFVRFDKNNKVIELLEKQPVSDEATVGIYNYKHGKDFVDASEEMILKKLKVNNEYYVAPAYNQMVEKGKKLIVYNIGSEMKGMYGMGIPSDLKLFETLDIAKKAINF